VSNDNLTPDQVAEALNTIGRQYGRTIILLDPLAGDHLLDTIDALTPPPARLRLDDPIFKGDLQSAPLLVELLTTEPTHQDLLAQSITCAQDQARNAGGPHSVCAWLFTEVSLKRLQKAMRQRLDARYPRGARIYLRFFDPRVLPRLAVLLGASTDEPTPPYSNLSQLLGPVHTWCLLNREGQLRCHDNPQPVNQAFGGYLRFDETMAAAIDRIEAINLTAHALVQRGTPCKQSDDALIDTHLAHAQMLGLFETSDLVAYAWRAMHHGAPFTRLPKMHELIAQAASHGIPFDALLEERFSPRAADITDLSERTA
jgi:hypothetical protein